MQYAPKNLDCYYSYYKLDSLDCFDKACKLTDHSLKEFALICYFGCKNLQL